MVFQKHQHLQCKLKAKFFEFRRQNASCTRHLPLTWLLDDFPRTGWSIRLRRSSLRSPIASKCLIQIICERSELRRRRIGHWKFFWRSRIAFAKCFAINQRITNCQAPEVQMDTETCQKFLRVELGLSNAHASLAKVSNGPKGQFASLTNNFRMFILFWKF